MRARYPDTEGFVERDGVKIGYEVFGSGPRTVLLMPTWTIVHSKHWKMQVGYLARRARVVTFDGRGNGRSDRLTETAGYASAEFVADAIAILDEVGVDSALVAGVSMGAGYSLELAATAPERVSALVLIAGTVPFMAPPVDEPAPEQPSSRFHDRIDGATGWDLYNAHEWREHYPTFVDFFMHEVLSEAHSTKPFEDATGWGLETTGETLAIAEDSLFVAPDRDGILALLSRVTCPTLVIHGEDDHVIPLDHARALASELDTELFVIEGGDHFPQIQQPVVVNRQIAKMLDRISNPAPDERHWSRALKRPKRVLYLSSPIGLGHSRRDIAIADELRRLHPDFQVDWLAQHPLTELLERRGESIHPASAFLASESTHIESECAEHDLHAFQTIRRMDEILLNNFMVFSEVVEEHAYDAWVGDEAWELDFFLHENPELKRAPYVWLTDFVGWLPMPDGGDHEAMLTADYNAEMVEQIARFPRLRDQSLFVGNPEDVVPDALGPALPGIREWTEAHFDFVGYVTGFDPAEVADTAAVRAELGYGKDEKVCIVTVGGSGVGKDLLRRAIAAYPEAKRQVPELRMIVVAGPRIDPASLPSLPGLEVHAYVHDLYRHLAVCDLAVVQGGLTTTMELTANRRPFIYVPLRHHFEQNFHVRHRLDRYGAGRCVDYTDTTPDLLAAAITEEIRRTVDYLPVETDGARRAAARIAELI
jgi:pimeloyl-ACP methyl ester carboxylesterase/predicted glycosyltransferase